MVGDIAGGLIELVNEVVSSKRRSTRSEGGRHINEDKGMVGKDWTEISNERAFHSKEFDIRSFKEAEWVTRTRMSGKRSKRCLCCLLLWSVPTSPLLKVVLPLYCP